MKKLIFIFLLTFIVLSVDKAKAQNGRNNNSDFKVPLPVVAPPLDPNFGFNISIPTMPPFTLPAGITPSLTATYLPQMPSAPPMPAAPAANMLQSMKANVTESNYPKVIRLPPLASIPPNPQVRLALY
ncbi:MAG: hypothetical protein EOO91_03355 [Pedobacter sp.]|nr:MAG: hypothetical protein EOO91_03355 [Pedobacter sp.]